jgi:hypothetical protein
MRGNVTVDSERPRSLLVTDFVNLKIKSIQFFEGAYRDRICMRVFIGVSVYICISRLYCVS